MKSAPPFTPPSHYPYLQQDYVIYVREFTR